MIDYINGTLTEKNTGDITVEAGGVGYGISVPVSTYEKLPDTGARVKIYTHYHVREDAHKLFGFLTKTERETFDLLIGVNGIGPKVALSVLSGASVADLSRAVASGDPSRLRSIPGIGPKIAQRLVMELKGKLEAPMADEPSRAQKTASKPSGAPKTRSEAYAAMLSLGYNEKQVQAAIIRVEETVDPQTPVEEWIRKALQVI